MAAMRSWYRYRYRCLTVVDLRGISTAYDVTLGVPPPGRNRPARYALRLSVPSSRDRASADTGRC